MDGSTLLLNVAYILLVSATFARAMLPLRVALLGAAVGFVVYGSIVGIWTMVGWNVLIALMHMVQIRRLLRLRRSVVLTDEEEGFREQFAPDADRFDFFSLWQLGREEFRENDCLTAQGCPVDSLRLVLDGTVDVAVDGAVIDHREAGAFIGELSLVSGQVASAETRATGPVHLRTWRQSDLRALDEMNPSAARLLDRLITADLAGKVRSQGH